MAAAELWWIFVSFLAVHLGFLTPIVALRSNDCPERCICLGDRVDCSKLGLKSVPEYLPVWVSILHLSNNELTSIPPGAFIGLASLQELDLSNNGLETFNVSAMPQLAGITKLKLSYNKLRTIPVMAAGNNLTELKLNHNEIDAVSSVALSRLPKLKVLDLSYNRLRRLEAGSIPLMPSLHHLYITNNKIRHIENLSLDNLTSLEWLKLSKNKIRHLPKEVFSKMKKLKYLDLGRNKIEVLEGLGFNALDSLVALYLKRNSIQTLSDGAFYGLTNIQTLDLDHNNISAVTRNWLYGLESLQKLHLSRNRISAMDGEGWEYCKSLRELDLSHNALQRIQDDTFLKLTQLQELFLSHNRISLVAVNAFQELVSLQTLDLSHNEISRTIEDMSGAFFGLAELIKLNLDTNRIKSVAKGAFEGMVRLKQLHLGNNALSAIHANAFAEMTRLQELHFNSSNFVCDCHLAWLPLWLVESGFQSMTGARCIHPDSLQGRSIFDVETEAFECVSSPKPVMQQHPESLAALKNSNASLSCRATSSSSSTLSVEWRKDDRLLLDVIVNNFASTSADGSTSQLTSVLLIEKVADEDGGTYQCIISNQLDSAYSAKAQVTVHVFPSFTKTPEDLTVRAGTMARLECSAQGQPQPEVAWQKDGGDDFPAARERRMQVMPGDDVFFIIHVKLEDEGVYSCTAKNDVGSIVANTTLKVLVMPAFTKPMENKHVQLGHTAVLECRASGSPLPKLRWLHNGAPLAITDRHHFTANNQLLIIIEAKASDEGDYSCEMSNTLGKESGRSHLRVIPSSGFRKVNPEETDYDGGTAENLDGSSNSETEDSTTTGIIIIAVVCCVVGTSLVWVIIIYKTRKKAEEYSSTPTDETTLPGDMPGTPFHSSDRDTCSNSSPGLLAPHLTGGYSKYPCMEVNGGFGFSPARVRTAAIFPSDVEDEEHRQAVPLTSDEHHPAESSDTSISMLRRLRNPSGSDTLTNSSRNSVHSNRSGSLLQTFHPLPSVNQPPTPTAESVHPRCDDCSPGGITIVEVAPASVHKMRPAYVIEDQTNTDTHHGSQPPGEDERCETPPPPLPPHVYPQVECATFPHTARPVHNNPLHYASLPKNSSSFIYSAPSSHHSYPPPPPPHCVESPIISSPAYLPPPPLPVGHMDCPNLPHHNSSETLPAPPEEEIDSSTVIPNGGWGSSASDCAPETHCSDCGSNQNVTISSHGHSYPNGHGPMTNGFTPVANGHVPIGNGHVPIGNGHVPIGNSHVPIGNGHVPVSNGHVSPISPGMGEPKWTSKCEPKKKSIFSRKGSKSKSKHRTKPG